MAEETKMIRSDFSEIPILLVVEAIDAGVDKFALDFLCKGWFEHNIAGVKRVALTFIWWGFL